MKQSVRILLAVSATLLSAASAFSQQPDLNTALDQAAKETDHYMQAFKDLLAEETRTIRIFDKRGEAKKTTVVKSTFIVYQMTKSQGSAEFRNVTAVDGKPVGNIDSRAQDFFEKIAKAESSKKEIDDLMKESSRHDGDLVIFGMTLFQSPALSTKLRPFFDFKLVGNSNIDGADVYEVSFQQTKPTPLIAVNSKHPDEENAIGFDIDADADGDLNGRLRGTLWIDAATFQIRREHRELTVQPEGFSAPVTAVADDFDFQKSDFGILTPRKIVHTQSRIKDDGSAVKENEIAMEYSNFSNPNVEVKSSEVNKPKQ